MYVTCLSRPSNWSWKNPLFHSSWQLNLARREFFCKSCIFHVVTTSYARKPSKYFEIFQALHMSQKDRWQISDPYVSAYLCRLHNICMKSRLKIWLTTANYILNSFSQQLNFSTSQATFQLNNKLSIREIYTFKTVWLEIHTFFAENNTGLTKSITMSKYKLNLHLYIVQW